MKHYYTDNADLDDNIKNIDFSFGGNSFSFKTNSGVFSKNAVDFGTRLLIETLKDQKIEKRVCDVGCGYGVIGICMKKTFPSTNVTMIDINSRAVSLSKDNALLNNVDVNVLVNNGLENIDSRFDTIITNPPIRAGKQIIFKIYEDAHNLLEKGGQLFIVIQKKQGADSTNKKVMELFGNCTIINKDKGYIIYKAIK